jgi:phosphoribosyl 1,2-cyclic phosphodiesterase
MRCPSLQLRCSDGQRSLGVLTDLGHAPAAVLHHLKGCQALLLECNHDEDLLSQSAYPHFLKRRVGGEVGHLSNAQSAGIAEQLKPSLRRVLAGHLSRQNNRPELAETALRQVLGDGVEIAVADALTGSGWLRV